VEKVKPGLDYKETLLKTNMLKTNMNMHEFWGHKPQTEEMPRNFQ